MGLIDPKANVEADRLIMRLLPLTDSDRRTEVLVEGLEGLEGLTSPLPSVLLIILLLLTGLPMRCMLIIDLADRRRWMAVGGDRGERLLPLRSMPPCRAAFGEPGLDPKAGVDKSEVPS